MKNKIALIVVIVAFMCLASCSRHGDWVNPRTLDESVLRISDSCATEPQRQLRAALLDIYFDKMKVVDNRFVLDVEPEYFTTLGISRSYCKMMKLELKETNECLDRWER